MTPEEYNRAVCLHRSQLWNMVFSKHYKPGKKAAVSIATVHADAAVAEHRRKFPADLNQERIQCPST